jgi:hypothetical protein
VTAGRAGQGYGNSKHEMNLPDNLRITGPPCLGAIFVFGLLLSFFQLSSRAIKSIAD